MVQRIEEVLMQRDGVSHDEAKALVREAAEALMDYIEDGDFESAEEVCSDFFGLEPDYLEQLL